jgi:hypothetical protein
MNIDLFRSFIQNSADVLKKVPSRIAVSPVVPLSSFRIAVIRLGGTPIAFASAFAVSPMAALECGTLHARDHTSAAALYRNILSGVAVESSNSFKTPCLSSCRWRRLLAFLASAFRP